MDRGLKPLPHLLDALFERTGSTSKFGLERTNEFLSLLGDPHRKITTIHVAGTNGKGSVVATLYTLLRAKGLRVGRYMSPHLVDFRERIVVDEKPVDSDYMHEFLNRWDGDVKRIGATFFEITTVMALDYFSTQRVDVAIIETGLGGRLDSTNVIAPIVTGITSISIDHQEYLGSTEAEIAREKAGIFKRGIPGVTGDMNGDARQAIDETASSTGAATIRADDVYRTSNVIVSGEGTTFDVEHKGGTARITTGLLGNVQAKNTAVALAMLDAAGPAWKVTLEEARLVLPEVRLAGRFQRFGRFIFDVAHNPDGMISFTSTLAQVRPPRPIVAVFGVLRDKDWKSMMTTLSSSVDEIVVVSPPSAPVERLWNAHEAFEFAQQNGINARIDLDFERAVTRQAESFGTVVVTGSFHTAGDALKILGSPGV